MVAAISKTDWNSVVGASKTSDAFTGWKSDPKTGTVSKVTSASQENTADELQNRFIKLLVAQLQNQDPNNPLDNAQVTSQMAQLSTVNGIQSLNDSFGSMAAMMTAGQTLQAAPLMGREVMYAGSSVSYKGAPAKLGFELANAADEISVSVKSISGEVVDTLDVGRKGAGMQVVEWDGKNAKGNTMPEGKYTFTVNARNATLPIDVKTYSVGSVNSIAQESSGAVLQTSQSDNVKFVDVKRVF
jgi:flagellar basal-body rod modification protein FlgD